MATVLFWMYAVLTVAAAVGVAVSENVVRMAVCLTTCLGAVSGLFLLFGADFVAAAQLMVYVGGTIILLIFGVMLTAASSRPPTASGASDDSAISQQSERASAVEILLATLFTLALGGLLVASVLQTDWGSPSPYRVDERTSGSIGLAMLGTPTGGTTSYLLPFEIVSMHLLVVLVGAAYLARATRTLRGGSVDDGSALLREPSEIDESLAAPAGGVAE